MDIYKVDVRSLTPETLEEILWNKCETVWFKDKKIWRKDANGVVINWNTKNFKINHIIPMAVVDNVQIFKALRDKFEFRLFNYQLESLETIDKFKGDTAIFHGKVGDYWIERKKTIYGGFNRFIKILNRNLILGEIDWK